MAIQKIRATIFFIINVAFFSLWFIAIIIVIIVIIDIVALIILIFMIILPKSIICKIPNINNIVVIVYYDK